MNTAAAAERGGRCRCGGGRPGGLRSAAACSSSTSCSPIWIGLRLPRPGLPSCGRWSPSFVSALDELKQRLAEVWDLRLTTWLLQWDRSPDAAGRRGGARRAARDARAHGPGTPPPTRSVWLLEQLGLEERLDYDSADASLIRVARRDWEKARRVPATLQADMARASVEGYHAWVGARQESDYSSFRPSSSATSGSAVASSRCFDDFDDPYDILLDDYEPDMKTAEAAAVLDRLKGRAGAARSRRARGG